MGKPNFSEDFKRDAVHQITVRGYAVREVSERLGVSTYSLYKWMKLYAKAASQTSSVDHEAWYACLMPTKDIIIKYNWFYSVNYYCCIYDKYFIGACY